MIGYYYAYENADTISLATRSEAFQDQAGPSNHALYRQPSNKSLAASYVNAPAEYPPEPILAPDCTACGTRLSYMRYVCIDCGEADMWQENDVAKNVYTSSDTGHSEGSGKTAFPAKLGQSTGTPRPRSESTSTNASRDSIQTMHGREVESVDSRGYELCPSCIEAHGIEHSKPPSLGAGRLGRRHTFREKVWGPQGWQDVGKFACLGGSSRLLTDQNTMRRLNAGFATLSSWKIDTNASRATNSISASLVGGSRALLATELTCRLFQSGGNPS